MAAGSLLITEAGGLVGDPKGEQDFLSSGDMLAGNPKVFSQLLQIIAQHTR
jgi:myo-inositol-1(or 4)-monophosphatase